MCMYNTYICVCVCAYLIIYFSSAPTSDLQCDIVHIRHIDIFRYEMHERDKQPCGRTFHAWQRHAWKFRIDSFYTLAKESAHSLSCHINYGIITWHVCVCVRI